MDGGSEPLRFAAIFGERCSGTNFLQALATKNFANIAITREFGGKHWFIRDHEPRGRSNETTDQQCIRPLTDANDTLFLVILRNPYDWLRSLQATPYHAWDHTSLPLSEFVTKPWVSKETSAVNPHWTVRDDNDYFIEEAANVLELRALKTRHFLGLVEVVPHIAVVRHEDLAANPAMIASIATEHGIELKPGPVAEVDRYFSAQPNPTPGEQRKYQPIGDDDLTFINQNLDWDVEALAGYSPADYTG